MEQAEKLIHEGNYHLNELEFKEALDCFENAIKLDPGSHQAYFGKAEASQGIKDVGIKDIVSDKIAADYEKAIELNDEDPLYYVRYGAFCMTEMKFKKAEECYNMAATLDSAVARHYYSEFANDYVFTENIRKELKKNRRKRVYSKALKYLLKGINLEPEEAIEVLTVMQEEGDEEEENPEE